MMKRHIIFFDSGNNVVKVVVLGGGLIGVASAYYLSKSGLNVTVIERGQGVALETSFANGGQISTSHTDPWATLENLSTFIKHIGQKSAPVHLPLQWDMDLFRWCARFLGNLSSAKSRLHTERMLKLALWSRDCLRDIQNQHHFNYDVVNDGILHIYHNQHHYERALKQAELVTSLGCDRRPVDKTEVLRLEPALTHQIDQIQGAVFCGSDESGNSYVFTKQLAKVCIDQGVQFLFSNPVKEIIHDDLKTTGVCLDNGEFINADAVVVAMGSYSAAILKPIVGYLPLYPAKGYSVTMPVINDANAPTVSLIDDEKKMVYSRFGKQMRVAGLAELVGFDLSIDPVRSRIPLENAVSLFPGAFDTKNVEFWCGLRPLTPDNVPIIGPAGFDNLFVNTGHGTLGWTMAAGSGQVISDLVRGHNPHIDMSGLGIERF